MAEKYKMNGTDIFFNKAAKKVYDAAPFTTKFTGESNEL
jgi:hypothetical protein